MKWPELLEMVADEPVFRTGFLGASGESLPALRLQLSRWVKAGKLVQPAKGLYTLAEPYRKISIHPFVLANAMKKASYVSLQSALAHFGMIPEHVPTVTSVTPQRPQRVETPLGCSYFGASRQAGSTATGRSTSGIVSRCSSPHPKRRCLIWCT